MTLCMAYKKLHHMLINTRYKSSYILTNPNLQNKSMQLFIAIPSLPNPTDI